jgi:hypothetical protein
MLRNPEFNMVRPGRAYLFNMETSEKKFASSHGGRSLGDPLDPPLLRSDQVQSSIGGRQTRKRKIGLKS